MRVYGERKATVVVRTLQHYLQARRVEVAELSGFVLCTSLLDPNNIAGLLN